MRGGALQTEQQHVIVTTRAVLPVGSVGPAVLVGGEDLALRLWPAWTEARVKHDEKDFVKTCEGSGTQ